MTQTYTTPPITVGTEGGKWYFMRPKGTGYWRSAARYKTADAARKAATKRGSR